MLEESNTSTELAMESSALGKMVPLTGVDCTPVDLVGEKKGRVGISPVERAEWMIGVCGFEVEGVSFDVLVGVDVIGTEEEEFGGFNIVDVVGGVLDRGRGGVGVVVCSLGVVGLFVVLAVGGEGESMVILPDLVATMLLK